jgi:tight adherence protein C
MVATPLLIAVSIFLFFSAVGYTVYRGLYGARTALEDQLNDLAVKVRIIDGALDSLDTEGEGLAPMLVQWASRRLPAPKVDTPAGEKLVLTLAHAGFTRPGAVRVLQVIRLVSTALGALLGFVANLVRGTPLAWGLVWALCGGAIASVGPSYYLNSRARRRQLAMGRELSDILDLLITCIESGLGIFEALRTVGREAQRQGRLLGFELLQLSAEIGAGSSLAQALRALAERTGVDDIKSVAAILIQSEKLGAQMAPALRACSDSLRTKRRMRAEEAAQKSTIKMLFPLVLFVLPAMLIVIIGPAMIKIIHTMSAGSP